ncbi:hypothetical protein [Nocardia sp. NPDC051750]|uniref:hypothetical protein n=1 Tax=Nocardia sp. NPDC051750 TaxID=3364325 RepID=UPI003787498C
MASHPEHIVASHPEHAVASHPEHAVASHPAYTVRVIRETQRPPDQQVRGPLEQ